MLMRSLFFVFGLSACTSNSAGDTAYSVDPCQAAADHVAACGGDIPAPEVDVCDPIQARAILDTECDSLSDGLADAKSDRFGYRSWACQIGLYHYCPVPVCLPEADEISFEAPLVSEDSAGSACLQAALEYQGCGACAYYACREANAHCGDDGYLIRFAEKYCLRYRMVSEPEASPEAKRWLRDARRCLITTLDAQVPLDDSCESFETIGFDSHPE